MGGTPSKRRTTLGLELAVVLASTALIVYSCSSLAPSGPICAPDRVGHTWYLDIKGPGIVHSVTAQGRTIRLPDPVNLRSNEYMEYDWSGAYAPDPGVCSVG